MAQSQFFSLGDKPVQLRGVCYSNADRITRCSEIYSYLFCILTVTAPGFDCISSIYHVSLIYSGPVYRWRYPLMTSI